MKNLTKIFALTALAALIALSMTAMSLTGQPTDDNSDGNSDPLNGTWTIWPFSILLKLDNGAFENSFRVDGAYHPYSKGTYTASGGEITMTITHVSGYYIDELFNIDAPKEWYSIDEFLQLAQVKAGNWADGVVEKGTYSLDNNEITMTVNGESITYTRK